MSIVWTILGFCKWFFLGTKLGRYALMAGAAALAFWWFVDSVADKREAAAVEKTTRKIETQITKTNTKAKSNADEAAERVRRCYIGGGAWSVREGKCREVRADHK